ncbi:MAG: hypothetical protein AAFY71_21320 [Bacteroidota bacterium]
MKNLMLIIAISFACTLNPVWGQNTDAEVEQAVQTFINDGTAQLRNLRMRSADSSTFSTQPRTGSIFMNRYSFSLGLGRDAKFENAVNAGLPVVFSYERLGQVGRYQVPDFLAGGGFIGFRSLDFGGFSEDNVVFSFSAGARASLLVDQAIEELLGKTVIPKGIEPYVTVLAGYEYIYSSSFYGYTIPSDFILSPIVGARVFPTKNIGLFVEIGRNAQGWINAGLSLRTGKTNSYVPTGN